jgi:GTP 3',8-cyclase
MNTHFLHDRHGRRLRYLRVSLTDRCNLRCVYCMPAHVRFRPVEENLTSAELIRLVAVCTRLGMDKVRLTGGEPTLRPDLTALVRGFASLPAAPEVVLTTNGLRLRELAAPLRAAGLRRVNVSLDSLHPGRFAAVTRGGRVDRVWDGILAAAEAGLGVKVNAVAVRGVTTPQDAVDLARLTLDHAWQVRFIEMMPLGGTGPAQIAGSVPEEELRDAITAALGPLIPENGGRRDGEAKVWRLPGAPGKIGFISSVTDPFCAGCDRLRLTADGKLRLCLLRDTEADLRAPLRAGASDDELADIIRRAAWIKPWGHGLADGEIAGSRLMSEIGG